MERRIIDVLMLVAPPAACWPQPLPTSEAASLPLSKRTTRTTSRLCLHNYGDRDYYEAHISIGNGGVYLWHKKVTFLYSRDFVVYPVSRQFLYSVTPPLTYSKDFVVSLVSRHFWESLVWDRLPCDLEVPNESGTDKRGHARARLSLSTRSTFFPAELE